MCLIFTKLNNVACNNDKQPHDCVEDVIVEGND